MENKKKLKNFSTYAIFSNCFFFCPVQIFLNIFNYRIRFIPICIFYLFFLSAMCLTELLRNSSFDHLFNLHTYTCIFITVHMLRIFMYNTIRVYAVHIGNWRHNNSHELTTVVILLYTVYRNLSPSKAIKQIVTT